MKNAEAAISCRRGVKSLRTVELLKKFRIRGAGELPIWGGVTFAGGSVLLHATIYYKTFLPSRIVNAQYLQESISFELKICFQK